MMKSFAEFIDEARTKAQMNAGIRRATGVWRARQDRESGGKDGMPIDRRGDVNSPRNFAKPGERKTQKRKTKRALKRITRRSEHRANQGPGMVQGNKESGKDVATYMHDVGSSQYDNNVRDLEAYNRRKGSQGK